MLRKEEKVNAEVDFISNQVQTERLQLFSNYVWQTSLQYI
jgi:hypothetical protein